MGDALRRSMLPLPRGQCASQGRFIVAVGEGLLEDAQYGLWETVGTVRPSWVGRATRRAAVGLQTPQHRLEHCSSGVTSFEKSTLWGHKTKASATKYFFYVNS